jgi:GalNAc-alpha-(1->4)-GalNAc-alpha-(1->3)-diNAcBac-PP-undecaprenol alpha-1,4-N-acetyl-D-galactosaminyltransferase
MYIILLQKKPRLFSLDPKVVVLENIYNSDSLSKILYLKYSLSFLRKTVKENQFDFLISHGEWIHSFCFFSLLGLSGKMFFFDHSNPLRGHQSPSKFLDKIAYRFASGVFVLSSTARDKMIYEFGQKNPLLIDNPVDLPPIGIQEKKEKIILCVGRLSPEKGQKVLIEALSKCKNLKGWKVEILGDGKCRKELEAMVDDLKLQKLVQFCGAVSDPSPYYLKSSIFILPSVTENFPLALIEAMACSCSVLMTDCIAWRGEDQFVEHGINGWKVPVNNAELMAEAIDKLISDENLRVNLGNEASKIRSRFEGNPSAKVLLEALERN